MSIYPSRPWCYKKKNPIVLLPDFIPVYSLFKDSVALLPILLLLKLQVRLNYERFGVFYADLNEIMQKKRFFFENPYFDVGI